MRLHTNEEMFKILTNKWNNDKCLIALKKCWQELKGEKISVESILHRYLDSNLFKDNQIDTESDIEVDKEEQIEWHLTDLKVKLCIDIEKKCGIVDSMDTATFDMF